MTPPYLVKVTKVQARSVLQTNLECGMLTIPSQTVCIELEYKTTMHSCFVDQVVISPLLWLWRETMAMTAKVNRLKLKRKIKEQHKPQEVSVIVCVMVCIVGTL